MATINTSAHALRSAALLAALTACLPAGKETLELPPSRSDLSARIVGQLSDGLDVRNLERKGDRLYAADQSGILIYDIATPSAPSLVGRIGDSTVDHVSAVDDVLYAINVSGDRLREWNVADASAPTLLSDERSITRTFGAISADQDLVWHAVGSSPPSRIFYRRQPIELANSCLADDRERGIMNVWLYEDLVILSVHFDDFAGDSLDGNGGFGFALLELERREGACPSTQVTDIVLADSHGLNRSRFEESTNSDLQAAYDPQTRRLLLTGEQRLRSYLVDRFGEVSLQDELAIPELLDVAIDFSSTETSVVGLANGDFALATVGTQAEQGAENSLEFATAIETPGTARAIAAAGDGEHFYIADGEAGIAVVAYGVSP